MPKYFFLCLLLSCSVGLMGQSSPRELLTQLFDGMRSGDSTGMNSLFYAGADLRSVTVDESGNTKVTNGSITDWLAGVHKAEAGALDEQLHYTEIRTDGALATAWTPYTFVLNGGVHHCGTNAFQMVREGKSGDWRIVHIMDTRNTADCGLAPTKPDVERITELANEWHAAAAGADLATFFGHMTPDVIYIGTDAGEHWTREEFYSFCRPYFEAGKAWDFTAIERHVFFDPNESVAYWDELLDTWMGPCRGTAVVKRDETGAWKIAHYTLSMTVPNDKVQEVIKVIGE